MNAQAREAGWIGALDRLDPHAKLVFYAIRDAGLGEALDGWVTLSAKEMAKATSLTPKQWDAAVKKLMGGGVIEGMARRRATSGDSWWYRLAMNA